MFFVYGKFKQYQPLEMHLLNLIKCIQVDPSIASAKPVTIGAQGRVTRTTPLEHNLRHVLVPVRVQICLAVL